MNMIWIIHKQRIRGLVCAPI